jgi:hypothetical protein
LRIVQLPKGIKTHNPESVRPFRIWDVKNRKDVRYRYYTDRKRAHRGAYEELRWEGEVGDVYEIYNCHTGACDGQYRRGVDSIQFYDPKVKL